MRGTACCPTFITAKERKFLYCFLQVDKLQQADAQRAEEQQEQQPPSMMSKSLPGGRAMCVYLPQEMMAFRPHKPVVQKSFLGLSKCCFVVEVHGTVHVQELCGCNITVISRNNISN